MNEWLNIKNAAGNVGEIHIYGMITDEKWFEEDVTPGWVKDQMAKLKDSKLINIFINSTGGGVFAGMTIYNMIKRFTADTTTYVDGVAASIASVIAMAAKKVVMPKNAMLMMHNPLGLVVGYAEDMRKEADLLDRIKTSIASVYVDKTKKPEKEILDMMTAETWMNGEEAVKSGFADVLENGKSIKACLQGTRAIVNGIEMDFGNFKSFSKSYFDVAPKNSGNKKIMSAKMKLYSL